MLKVYKKFPHGVCATPMWRTCTLFLAAFESHALLVVSLGWLVQ